MDDRIHDAFHAVKASEDLKLTTLETLRLERARRSPRRTARRGGLLMICAGLLLAVGVAGFAGFRLVRTPVAYVSIDVNPSMELALNRWDRIVGAEAYSDDGAVVLESLNLNGKLYTDGITLILNCEAMQPYLADPAAALTVTVASEEPDKGTALLTGLETCDGWTNHMGQSSCVDMDSLPAAHHHGLSFGKYAAYLTLSQYDSSLTVEDCHHMTMAEIQSQIESFQTAGESAPPVVNDNGGSGGAENPEGVSESCVPCATPESTGYGHSGGHHGHSHE